MSLKPRSGDAGASPSPALSQQAAAGMANAYVATYRGPHADAPESVSITGPVNVADHKVVTPELLAAHHRLGHQRPVGRTRVAVYSSDDAGGFGPALQIVTDDTAMVMDSVTVLLHRFGVPYTAVMNPVFLA
ncbi:hypothetical protein ABQF26_25300, partial [Mycolicibacterium elephantis]